MTQNVDNAIEMMGICKSFGSKVANKDVNLDLKRGEILALLGENGSGKTSLMNMLAGIYFPDSGKIFVDGKEVVIKSPIDAHNLKIGMIHQHFKLIDLFSACDNVILGEKFSFDVEGEKNKIKEDNDKSAKGNFLAGLKYCALAFRCFGAYVKFNHLGRRRAKALQEQVDKYGFQLDLSRKVYDMSVSEKQTVEIIKVLYRGADILILDEPTAVLTPQEIKKLFAVLRKMKEDGKSIIIITHKLNEVLEISDRVAVLRRGMHVGTVETDSTDEKELTELMVGDKVELNINRTEPKNVREILKISNLSCHNRDGRLALDNVSFSANTGEILGIAGISGSGQRELLEAIAGLVKIENGDVIYYDHKNCGKIVDLRQKTPRQIRELGVRLSFVPEDRLGMGLVGNMDLTDNMMLRSYSKGHSAFLDRKSPHDLAEHIVNDLQVSTPDLQTPVRKLSGGNVQKVLVGREIAATPTVLLAAYPVRGLDINSSFTIYNLLNQQKVNGASVVFVGEDLDVLLALSDRILVLCGGKVSGIVDARTTTKEDIGLLMTTLPQTELNAEEVQNEK